MSLPPAVVARLIDSGSLSLRRTGRRATGRRCKCGRGVVSGLDADTCALDVDADPVAINELGELEAIAAGLLTFDLCLVGVPMLERRRFGSVRRAGWLVLPEHRCSVVPSGWRAPKFERLDPPAPEF